MEYLLFNLLHFETIFVYLYSISIIANFIFHIFFLFFAVGCGGARDQRRDSNQKIIIVAGFGKARTR